MAIAEYALGYTDTGSEAAFVAPTLTNSVPNPSRGVILAWKNGATSTTITIVRPGNDEIGEPRPDKVIAVAASGRGFVKLDEQYRDGNGNAVVDFANITTITALVIRG